MIQMIAGVFGLPVDGIIKGMDKNSGPFEAGAEQETRLVKLGLAVYVDGGTTALPDGVHGVPAYDENTSAKELREIGKSVGLTFRVGMTKAEMVAALDDHIDEHSDEHEVEAPIGFDEHPEEEADEPAPTFDAAEAVQ